ncbi:porin family protein [Chryseobacterium sp. POL2]|uniref:outer membrane beta-barrel protein n=1 Tax=Chryseobacterium sp. POL2 TaxID=2713414 RepID=UPI0013E1C1C4|nr:outer membrane beta-barrel protein [Chryseobacterium sp. POL2]QIG90139.1 porin family protein [Chryseobacterium sp. POL2]
MKKLITAMAMFASVAAFSQITFGARANLLFNTSSAKWSDFKNTVSDLAESKGKSNTGFNFGLSAKINLPVTSLYVMPEIYYTTIKNTVEFTDAGKSVELEAKNERIDIPVLLGYNLMGETLSAFVGPVFSYNMSKDNKFQNFTESETKDFGVGYQFGANVTLKKFVINARYEGAFSKDERKFINTVAGSEAEINYDNRPSFFILGLGYNF